MTTELDSQHVLDLLRYFLPNRRVTPHWTQYGKTGYPFALFEGGEFVEVDGVRCIDYAGDEEAVLRRAGAWPDASMYPPPPRFANIGTGVMQGSEFIATASSNNMAKRIANALNWYKPGKRGT